MPINLNAIGLIPSAPYNVSISMKIGDKEIDSLRSFSTVLPPIFNQNLANYAPRSATIAKTYTSTRERRDYQPPVFIGSTVKVVKVKAALNKKAANGGTNSGWTGSLDTSSATYAPRIDITFKFDKSISNASFNAPLPTNTSDPGINAMFQLGLSGSGISTTKKKNYKATVSVASLGFDYVNGTPKRKGYWYAPLRDKFFSGTSSKGYLTIPATLQIGYWKAAVPALAGVKQLTSKLTASLDPSMLQYLTVDEDIKDVVYFLYSDSPVDVPDITTYRFLDDNFNEATGADIGSQGWTQATGTYFKNGLSYNFPAYDATELINYTRVQTDLINKIVFSNETQSVDNGASSVSGEVEGTESFPTQISITFIIVRYTSRPDGGWDRDWLSKDASGNPILSSPVSAGFR